jgi:hypothetical protein
MAGEAASRHPRTRDALLHKRQATATAIGLGFAAGEDRFTRQPALAGVGVLHRDAHRCRQLEVRRVLSVRLQGPLSMPAKIVRWNRSKRISIES